ncbi:hypothetical protein D3C80_2060670 [compost metagenome]
MRWFRLDMYVRLGLILQLGARLRCALQELHQSKLALRVKMRLRLLDQQQRQPIRFLAEQ